MTRQFGVLILGAAFLLGSGRSAFAGPFADAVAYFNLGSGFGVECSDPFGPPYTGACGEGVFDEAAVTALDGVSLALGGATGTPGSIALLFTGGVVTDGPGADLVLYDSFGLSEGFVLRASSDGVNFVSVGTFPGSLVACFPTCATLVDLSGSGVAAANFFEITAHQPTSVLAFPEAYDLDALEALHFSTTAPVPEPASIALLGLGLLSVALRSRRA